MRIVISDSSCIIGLWKASLLDVFLKLPYEIRIPNTLFEEELGNFIEAQKCVLIKGGLKVIDLRGEQVLRAQQIIHSAPRLSITDGFAFALAECQPGYILLAGNGCLRDLAIAHQIEVHDLLWVVNEMHQHKLRAADVLCAALRVLANDPAVTPPPQELAAVIKRLESL